MLNDSFFSSGTFFRTNKISFGVGPLWTRSVSLLTKLRLSKWEWEWRWMPLRGTPPRRMVDDEFSWDDGRCSRYFDLLTLVDDFGRLYPPLNRAWKEIGVSLPSVMWEQWTEAWLGLLAPTTNPETNLADFRIANDISCDKVNLFSRKRKAEWFFVALCWDGGLDSERESDRYQAKGSISRVAPIEMLTMIKTNSFYVDVTVRGDTTESGT